MPGCTSQVEPMPPTVDVTGRIGSADRVFCSPGSPVITVCFAVRATLRPPRSIFVTAGVSCALTTLTIGLPLPMEG